MHNNALLKRFMADKRVLAGLCLAFVWLAGLIIGSFQGSFVAREFASAFLPDSLNNVTLLFLVLSALIPVVATALVAYLFGKRAVLAIAFLKAVLFSTVATACVLTWGSAGWLISWLLFLPVFLTLPFLIWLWLRILCNYSFKTEMVIALTYACFVGLLNYFVIAPFISSLFLL